LLAHRAALLPHDNPKGNTQAQDEPTTKLVHSRTNEAYVFWKIFRSPFVVYHEWLTRVLVSLSVAGAFSMRTWQEKRAHMGETPQGVRRKGEERVIDALQILLQKTFIAKKYGKR
jgi:hypothetical protein